MADRVVRPEVEVETVGGGEVAGGGVVATEPPHQRPGGQASLPHLQDVVVTGGVSLQLKMYKLYLNPEQFAVRKYVEIDRT